MRSKPAIIDTRPIFEELEPRQLFSGGLEGVILDDWSAESATYMDFDSETSRIADSTDAAQVSQPESLDARRELVFIDTDVKNYQQLLDDILAQDGAERNIEFVVLDNQRDGIEQISEVLARYKNLDAVHLISHGADGSVELGRGALNFDTLLKQASQIQRWGNALTDNADILIYGCDVAAQTDGKALVDALSRLTGADVTASTNVTGSSALGGNWVLEVHSGIIESGIAVTGAAQQT